jgi:hypothetical protein
VHAVARRPLGDTLETALLFQDTGKGRFVGDTPLITAGQWDLMITVTADGRELVTTRRIIVP